MYCKGDRGVCSNCGHEAYEHTHGLTMGNDGFSATVSVDNACTRREAITEAKRRLEQGVMQMFDISNADIDNSMTCIVKDFEFENVELL